MKAIILFSLIVLASCSSEDPKPQQSCEALRSELQSVQKQLTEHQARGAQGNQSAWETELKRLMNLRDQKQHEVDKRLC